MPTKLLSEREFHKALKSGRDEWEDKRQKIFKGIQRLLQREKFFKRKVEAADYLLLDYTIKQFCLRVLRTEKRSMSENELNVKLVAEKILSKPEPSLFARLANSHDFRYFRVGNLYHIALSQKSMMIEQILRLYGRPLLVKDIFESLTRQGYKTKSKRPLKDVRTTLVRNKQFCNLGNGMWDVRETEE
jgi:hypothetical protein